MWTYRQSTGDLVDAHGQHVATGYSGHGEGKNNPTMEQVHNVGPIPRGGYTIGEPFDSATHGPYALHLVPDSTNEMYGRSAFLMHGDSLEHPGAASEGCIIIARPVREHVWTSGDHQLRVAV